MAARTMAAAVYHGPRDIRLEDVPIPGVSPGGVLVEVLRSGMCGTDVTEWTTGPKLTPLYTRHPHSGHRGPMIQGHEMVGRVVEETGTDLVVGSLVVGAASVPCWQCDRCLEGRTNICQRLYSLGLNANGSHAEFVAGPARSFLPLPDGLSIDAAGITQPLAVGVHAARRAAAAASDRVVLLGAGAIGTFILAGLLHLVPALQVTVVDIDPIRLERASRLGASETANRRSDESLRGADILIEATGAPGQLAWASAIVRPGGRILAVGMPAEPAELDFHHLVFNEITIETSVALTFDSDLPIALELLGQSSLAEEMIHSIRPLNSIPDTLDELAAGHIAGKVLIDPKL